YTTVKYDASGTQQWVARYNGPGNSADEARALAVDITGNVYVTGSSTGSGTNYDYATVKYDASGTQQWVARYNGPGNSTDRAYALAVDSSRNVYVTGSSTGSGTSDDYATVKYDSGGNQLWATRYNGPGNIGDRANALAVDITGSVYVTGYSYGGSSTGNDYATVKYDASGTPLWVARYNGPGNSSDYAYALAVDITGSVYVTGYSYGGSSTDYDYATVKYDASGTPLWAARYNGPGNIGDSANALAVDITGSVYVTGYSYGSGTDYDYATIKYQQGAPPTADFLGSPTSGKIPHTVTFTDTSTGASISSRLWSYDDGVTSTLQNPTHTYSSPGVYTVSLTVTNAYGSNTRTRTSYISAQDMNAAFSGSPTLGHTPLTVSFTDASTVAVGSIASWYWTFGPPGADTSTAQNPTFTYSAAGIYTVSLTVTDTFGLSDTETKASYITAIGANLVLQLAFQGGSYGTDRYVNPIKVTLAASPAVSYVVTTTNTGVLTLTGIPPGTYTITAGGPHALANRKTGVVVTAPSTSVDMGTLKEGDANMNGQVSIQDFGYLAKHYLAVGNADACRWEFLDWVAAGGTPWVKTASTYNCWTDFDKSGQINISDFGLLTGSYLQTGPVHLP
ncbi:MAG: SBBP repeat-containing protein, partial [Chloroflexi bacterium]|nr:SBBP repeat-containing protein [Chloroflexota bacterium]